MATTTANEQQLTITLPASVVEKVKSKIAAGDFANEEEFVIEGVLRLLEDDEHANHGLGTDEFDEWLRTEAVPVLEALQADPSRGLSIEEVRANLALAHKDFQKAG